VVWLPLLLSLLAWLLASASASQQQQDKRTHGGAWAADKNKAVHKQCMQ
jgi:hypothetical protein